MPDVGSHRANEARGAALANAAMPSAIMHEIRWALARLAEHGDEHRIDLSTQPFGPGDLERLREWLGRGEVTAEVESLGTTRVEESAIPGVWLVDYRNSDSQRLTLHIEIANVPEILRTQPEDLAEALARLDAHLEPTPSPHLPPPSRPA